MARPAMLLLLFNGTTCAGSGSSFASGTRFFFPRQFNGERKARPVCLGVTIVVYSLFFYRARQDAVGLPYPYHPLFAQTAARMSP